MAFDENANRSYLDDDDDDSSSLYCDEQQVEDDETSCVITSSDNAAAVAVLFPVLLLEQDLFWDDEDLKSLFNKEQESAAACLRQTAALRLLSLPRKQAVEWILTISSHYGFSPFTAILAVNYLDRFVDPLCLGQDKQHPWMMQLAAVACLSLAAKVEETHVPLLLDLQVGGAEYVFKAKTIQRMELLVLSSLKWRMNPVTPLSFIHHLIRRLGLKISYSHWEFLKCCENLLLSLVPDPRFMLYLPSVVATTTMLRVIHRVEPRNAAAYQNQLLSMLKISKEEVNACHDAISDILSNACWAHRNNDSTPLKRNHGQLIQTNPTPDHVIFKKRRVEHQGMSLPSLSRVVVTANPN